MPTRTSTQYDFSAKQHGSAAASGHDRAAVWPAPSEMRRSVMLIGIAIVFFWAGAALAAPFYATVDPTRRELFSGPPPAASASGTATPSQPSAPRALAAPQHPHPAVVRVIVAERGATSYGSGTLVAVEGDHGLVVTNWHVVRDMAGEIVVQFPDGFRSTAQVLRTDRPWDLAALWIRRPNVEPVPVASQPPRPGDVLTIAGYGQGNYRAATGRCTQYMSPGSGHPFEMVEVSAQARQGDSGGPIFNQRGELAGVLFGAARGTTTGSYAGRVDQFLVAAWPDYRNARPADPSQPPAHGREWIASRQRPSAARAAGGRSRNGDYASIAPLPPVAAEVGRGAAASDSAKQRPTIPLVAAPSLSPTGDGTASEVAATSSTMPLADDWNLTWEDLAGTTVLDQVKTVLATLAVLLLGVQGLRALETK